MAEVRAAARPPSARHRMTAAMRTGWDPRALDRCHSRTVRLDLRDDSQSEVADETTRRALPETPVAAGALTHSTDRPARQKPIRKRPANR